LAALLGVFVGVSLNAAPANAAVVYCKTVGVPKGCVMRTTPVARAVVTPGVGSSGVARHADESRRCCEPCRPSLIQRPWNGAIGLAIASRTLRRLPMFRFQAVGERVAASIAANSDMSCSGFLR
jgi:hypothetical protein